MSHNNKVEMESPANNSNSTSKSSKTSKKSKHKSKKRTKNKNNIQNDSQKNNSNSNTNTNSDTNENENKNKNKKKNTNTEDTTSSFNMFSMFSRKSDENLPPRKLEFNKKGHYKKPEDNDQEAHVNNKIKTSKYSFITFLPLNLFEQLIRPANFYFCIIAALQSIPEVSISGGTPTILVPLTFVFAVTALKDAMEDLKRHRDDKAENQRAVEILRPNGKYETVQCEGVHVGDIVRVRDHQRFPADLLLLTSAKGHKAPYCYVETSNIDGETNLKLKQSPEGTNSLPSFDNLSRASVRLLSEQKSASRSFTEFKKRMKNVSFESEPPNGQLDTWSAMIKNISVPVLSKTGNNGSDDDDESKSVDLEDINIAVEFDHLKYSKRNIRLTIDNLLLRGSELRNSDWIYALVLYTGFDCKIFMNNKSREAQRLKRSSVEKTMNKFIFTMAFCQFLICIMCAVLAGEWLTSNADAWYLSYQIEPSIGAFYKFFTWFIIFAQFIPISLLVSMEIVKFIQAQFMQWDINMYVRINGKQDKFCSVQSSNLNEELGQIQYVFSDKTGTLTDNSLDFRKCVIGNENYGTGETEIGRAAKRREEEMREMEEEESARPPVRRAYTSDHQTQAERHNNAPHVNFDEEDRLRKLICVSQSPNPTPQSMLVRRFLTVLAVNNSCFPVIDEDTQQLAIRASSPDDECLTCFAQYIGVQLSQRKPPHVTLDIVPERDNPYSGFNESWEQLAELEFTSKRKRMTMIIRNRQTQKVHFTMKGADSEMQRFVANYDSSPHRQTTEDFLNSYSEEGLRTLVIGEAILSPEWWDERWRPKFERFQEETLIAEATETGHIKGSCSDECRKCLFYEEIEFAANIELLGVTAIEDKLQESVPETISALLDGGINVWVLTGDKQKTAENIGIACNLLEPAMEKLGLLFKLTTPSDRELRRLMLDAIETIDNHPKRDTQSAGMVINSKALKTVMTSTSVGGGSASDDDDARDLRSLFLELSQKCKSVIGVRMQPNQKAQIIKFIQSRLHVRTLAIGDGANDEPMIKCANVGVGIAGLEGTAAVRASDYAIGKFKFLKRLMFVHGRLHYRRITTLVCYMFYKNGLLSLSSFWFGLYNGFSGQILYLEWAYQLYNVVFTSLPIFYYAVVDRDYTDEYLINHPELYQVSQAGKLFNAKVFFSWILDSLLASFLIVFIPVQCYAYMTSPDESGQSSGIWTTGVCCYTIVVFTANIRLAFVTTSWTWITHLFFWGSIISYFVCMIVFNVSTIWAKAGADYYWVVFRSMSTWRYWLVALLSPLIALFIPFTYVSFSSLRQKAKYLQHQQNLYGDRDSRE